MRLPQLDLASAFTIVLFVLIFLHIHPFQDGNGRLSRALTTLLLLQLGYSYVLYSSFERVIEENKNAYYLALRRGQGQLENSKAKEGGMTDWLIFFLRSMRQQKINLESKMKEELLASQLFPWSLQIIELIKGRGPSSISEILKITQSNCNTIKLHLRNLVKDKYLFFHGVGRATLFEKVCVMNV